MVPEMRTVIMTTFLMVPLTNYESGVWPDLWPKSITVRKSLLMEMS